MPRPGCCCVCVNSNIPLPCPIDFRAKQVRLQSGIFDQLTDYCGQTEATNDCKIRYFFSSSWVQLHFSKPGGVWSLGLYAAAGGGGDSSSFCAGSTFTFDGTGFGGPLTDADVIDFLCNSVPKTVTLGLSNFTLTLL